MANDKGQHLYVDLLTGRRKRTKGGHSKQLPVRSKTTTPGKRPRTAQAQGRPCEGHPEREKQHGGVKKQPE